jgi:hypothetical protein
MDPVLTEVAPDPLENVTTPVALSPKVLSGPLVTVMEGPIAKIALASRPVVAILLLVTSTAAALA